MKKYKFKGWDWSEIFEAANLEVKFNPPLRTKQDLFVSFEDEDKFLKQELDRLYAWSMENTKNSIKLEKWFRNYMKVFLPYEKKMHYHYSLWVGLYKIKERESFLKYVYPLFFYMWN